MNEKIADLISEVRDQIEEAEGSISCARDSAKEVLDYCESADREMVLARKKLEELEALMSRDDIEEVKKDIGV